MTGEGDRVVMLQAARAFSVEAGERWLPWRSLRAARDAEVILSAVIEGRRS